MISVLLDRYWRNLRKKSNPRLSFLYFLALLVSLMVLFRIIVNSCNDEAKPEVKGLPRMEVDDRPTYMISGSGNDFNHLKHVTAVLDRLGFRRVYNSTNFDLLWSHDYPFGESGPFSKVFFQNLKPHQRVNHFPGSGIFTNKVDLAVTRLESIPRAFKLPDQKTELLNYSAAHPNLLFVQKNNTHRGIKILKLEEMNLESAGTFIQEFVSNPFLVDGYKFDIGIYTVITSIDPLRIYIYNGDVLIRFCAKPYEKFDPNDIDSYVVGDDYTPIWEVPSLKKPYSERKFSMKETLNAYVRQKGMKPEKIWKQIENSIVNVLLNKEEKMAAIAKGYKNTRNFFEMVRFDFIIDSDLKVYLMEANMSPNLSSEHFSQNKVLYENVIFGLFSLVGLGKRTKTLKPRSVAEDVMEVPEKGLMVFGDECTSEQCDYCGIPQCALCKHCLTFRNLQTLKNSYLEHLNRLDYKRIFPPKMKSKTNLDKLDLENYSPENRFMTMWFFGKCQQDESWC